MFTKKQSSIASYICLYKSRIATFDYQFQIIFYLYAHMLKDLLGVTGCAIQYVSLLINSCQLLKLISISCSGSVDLNITQLQSSDAGLEAESSHWGVLKMLRWDLRVELNFDILTDNVLFDYVYSIILFSQKN